MVVSEVLMGRFEGFRPALFLYGITRSASATKNSIGFHIYGIRGIINIVKKQSIRTTLDIPAPLYRRLKEQAAARGSSIRELVLLGVKNILLQEHRLRPKRVQFPLIVSEGPKVNLTNEQVYEHVEFP